MKKIILFLLFLSQIVFSQNKFNRGVNLTLWFQEDDVRKINFTKFEKSDFQILPDSDDVIIYTDYLGKNVDFNRYSTDQYDLYNENQPASGRHCLKWENPAQYQSLSFDFIHDKDFTFLYSEDYTVDFDIRCDKSDLNCDIRFLDTDTEDPADHPWRMNYTFTTADAQWNGEWQHISIPLSKFVEHGAYEDGTWYNPENKFDWSKIDCFEIVSEHLDLSRTEIYVDEIRIIEASSVPSVIKKNELLPTEFNLFPNYPNPFNPSTMLRYFIPTSRDVKLTVYDNLGKEIANLVDQYQQPGYYSVIWNSYNHPSGIYFFLLETEDFKKTTKGLLIK